MKRFLNFVLWCVMWGHLTCCTWCFGDLIYDIPGRYGGATCKSCGKRFNVSADMWDVYVEEI